MITTERSPLSIHTSINYISEFDVISRWVNEAPDEKQRGEIASKIKEACQTGVLILDYNLMKNITSLPPIPEGILSLEINCSPKLHTFPILPESLKELGVFSCWYVDVNNLPSGIENLKLKSVKKISDIPCSVRYLSIERCNIPVLPKGIIKLKLDSCNGESIISDSLINLKNLEIRDCEEINFSSLPSGLEVISITKKCISLPSLPADLLTLSLSWSESGLTGIPVLPDKLKELDLRCDVYDIPEGEDFIIPTTLPATLSKINLDFKDNKKWNISEKDLPSGINVCHVGVIINPECYNRQDVFFDDVYSEASLTFKRGDVLYGLSNDRAKLRVIIEGLNGFDNKDIVLQNKLTNSVWNRYYPQRFNSDDKIINSLNDSERGLKFKKFLEEHKKYNVTDEKFRDFHDMDLWAKTSKAGLEFQTKVREEKVIFCIDKLIDSIESISGKEGIFGQAISAHELRWIYRNRNDDKIKENVVFSLQGKIVPHETVFSLKDWELYQPKNMRIASGE